MCITDQSSYTLPDPQEPGPPTGQILGEGREEAEEQSDF